LSSFHMTKPFNPTLPRTRALFTNRAFHRHVFTNVTTPTWLKWYF